MKFWARASANMTPRACNGGAAMRKTVLAAVLAALTLLLAALLLRWLHKTGCRIFASL